VTFVGATVATSGSTAAIAAAQARQREEEEVRTPYTEDELVADYEFKILRAVTSRFDKPETLREVLEEEARAGWTLLEKFDGQRLRLKRPSEAKKGDHALLQAGIDPYRTWYGLGQGALAGAILVGVCLLAGAVIVAVALFA
jgi:hypothetical protein